MLLGTIITGGLQIRPPRRSLDARAPQAHLISYNPGVPTLHDIWPDLEEASRGQGVIAIGASGIGDDHGEVFERWLDRGHDATMGWLRKNREVRRHPSARFPWARSAVSILVPYSNERPTADQSLASRIARYAQGDDYHEVVDEILRMIEKRVAELAPESTTRRYVDTGPLSDRALASAGGLGWIGKNSMLIHPEHGSWTFIGILLTSLENDTRQESVADMCGACTRCVEACPTNAILPDRTGDSNLCISYLTIEHRGPLPEDLRHRLEGNVFGCDICQEVCPWNESAPAGLEQFAARSEYIGRPISALISMPQSEFSTVFRKSAVKRTRLEGMVRNAKAAIGDRPK